VGLRLQQKSMTLNINLLLCRPYYAYCDQTAEAMNMRFLTRAVLNIRFVFASAPNNTKQFVFVVGRIRIVDTTIPIRPNSTALVLTKI